MKALDTTVAVDHLRGNADAVSLLEGLNDEDQALVASEIVRFELLAGVRANELEALELFCSSLQWVTIDEQIVRAAGSLAREHHAAYSGIDDADYLIAATAITLEAELLTTNVRHFPMFAELRPAY